MIACQCKTCRWSKHVPNTEMGEPAGWLICVCDCGRGECRYEREAGIDDA